MLIEICECDPFGPANLFLSTFARFATLPSRRYYEFNTPDKKPMTDIVYR